MTREELTEKILFAVKEANAHDESRLEVKDVTEEYETSPAYEGLDGRPVFRIKGTLIAEFQNLEELNLKPISLLADKDGFELDVMQDYQNE